MWLYWKSVLSSMSSSPSQFPLYEMCFIDTREVKAFASPNKYE